MFDWLRRRLAELRFVMLGLLVLALPGVAGWFVADWLWDNGEVGAFVPYAVGAILWVILSDERTFVVTLSALVAFVVFLPVIYVLVLIVQVLLLSFYLAPYAGIGNFMLRNLDGVFLGTGLGAGLTLVGTLKTAAQPSGPDPRPDRPDLDEVFLMGLSFRIPLAFFLAGLMDIPEAPSARLVLGAAWGIVAAASALVYTSVVDKEPIKNAWLHVCLTELVLLFGGLWAALDGLTGDRKILYQALQLVPAAAVACAGTYLFACLIAAVGVWARAVHYHVSRQ